MQIKSNHVNMSGLAPQLVLALFMVEQVFNKFGREVTITSVNDSTHSETSLHYAGHAVDIRTHNPINGMPYFEDPLQVVQQIKSKLNADFDVLYEESMLRDKPVGHIHLEYQPRRKT